MNKSIGSKAFVAGSLAAFLFAIFALTTAFSAPVVVVPGEGAGYIYYSASSGAGAAPAAVEDPTFVGMVAAFLQTPPNNWVECAGQTISAAAYPELVNFLAGASATAATMPDLRGYFLRGWDSMGGTNAGVDPDGASRGLNEVQADAFQGHWHTVRQWASHANNKGLSRLSEGTSYSNTLVKDPVTDGVNGIPRTAPETRPKNISVIYAMRAK